MQDNALTGRPFRWALLGTGSVSRKFARDLRAMGGAELAVVASRQRDRADAFARDLGVMRVATDYAAAVADDVDAVYVATPAVLHEEHALMAIAAGKPVLVEKPIAPDAAAARRIADAAAQAGVFCMEALWVRLQPLPGALQKKIAAGDLGEMRGFDASFMIANEPDGTASLFDPAQAGGGLLHRGIYPVSLARFFLGPVTEIRSLARRGTTGVDEDCVLLLQHHGGALSSLRASLRAHGRPGARLYGTAASVAIEGPIWRPTGAVVHRTTALPAHPGGPRRLEGLRESATGLRLSALKDRVRQLAGRGVQRVHAPFAGNGYRHEALALMQAVAEGRTEDPRMTPAESIEVLEIMDAARAAWSAQA